MHWKCRLEINVHFFLGLNVLIIYGEVSWYIYSPSNI